MRRRRPSPIATTVAGFLIMLSALIVGGEAALAGDDSEAKPDASESGEAAPPRADADPQAKDRKAKDKTPRKGGLSLDELMKKNDAGTEAAVPVTPTLPSIRPKPKALADPLLPAPSPSDPSRGQLSLDGIEAGREAVKVADAQERIRGLSDRLQGSCACVAGSSCFQVPRFEHDEMNAAIAQQAGDYERQARELCAQWNPGALNALPAERPALIQVEEHLQSLIDTKRRMHAALDTRADAFLEEQNRIKRAIAEAEAAAAAEAQALAQQNKKRSGLMAGLLTMGAGAVLADSLGVEIDPDKLAKTSLDVSRAVANGEGVAGAIGAGVQGLSDMAHTAVPRIDVPAPPAGGDMFADAMAHVKRFPEPGAVGSGAPGAGAPGTALPSGSGAPGTLGAQGATPSGVRDYGDLLGAVGSPVAPALPEGISPEAMAQASVALQRGLDMQAAGGTPGGPGTDAFGVAQPTIERFTFSCKEHSIVPLSDGAGGTKYYYEREVSGVIKYWTPACGPAFKAYYIAHACNNIDDFSAVEAGCVAACGAPDCRDAIYEQRVLGGGS